MPHPHLLFPICCLKLPLNCELFGVATIFYSIYPAKHSRMPPRDCSYKGATILQINIKKKKKSSFHLPKGSTGFAFPHWVLSSELFLITKWRKTKQNKQKPHNPSSFSCRTQCEEIKVSWGYVSGLVFFFNPKALRDEGDHSWWQKWSPCKYMTETVLNIEYFLWDATVFIQSVQQKKYIIFFMFPSLFLMFVYKPKWPLSTQKFSLLWHFCFPITSFIMFSVLHFCC